MCFEMGHSAGCLCNGIEEDYDPRGDTKLKKGVKMFKLEIKTENAAFTDDPRGEIGRILEELVVSIRNGKEPSRLLDSNGNCVGSVTWAI